MVKYSYKLSFHKPLAPAKAGGKLESRVKSTGTTLIEILISISVVSSLFLGVCLVESASIQNLIRLYAV